jgi:hypothetical protein
MPEEQSQPPSDGSGAASTGDEVRGEAVATGAQSKVAVGSRMSVPYSALMTLMVLVLVVTAGAISTRRDLDDPMLIAVSAAAAAAGALAGRFALSFGAKLLGGVRSNARDWRDRIAVPTLVAAALGVGIYYALTRIVTNPDTVTVVVSGYALLLAAAGFSLNIGLAAKWGTPTSAEVAPVVADRVEALLGERLFGADLESYDGWVVAAVADSRAGASQLFPAGTVDPAPVVVTVWLQAAEPSSETVSAAGKVTAWDRVLIADGRPAQHVSFTLSLIERRSETGAVEPTRNGRTERRQRVVQTRPDGPSESATVETRPGSNIEVYVTQQGRTVQILTVKVPGTGSR